MKQIDQNPRLSLLRCFAALEDAGRGDENWPEWCPLFEGEWPYTDEMMVLAVKEATALGHVESRALHAGNQLDRIMADLRGGRDWMVKITPAGYNWIRAHDATGEAMQEVAP